MKKALIKSVAALAILFVIIISSLVALNISPFLYTKLHGNKETETLYAAYKMAKNSEPFEHTLEYLHNNNIEYIEHKNEDLISLHAGTEGHGETVLIWHKGGKATEARFDDFL